ncbi:transcriptional regulator (ArsR family) [Oceanobacillus iheyensis HTE831]|uniref:Transcriptional regulator (ArsR family) n=1 Tax=Oceanobacillus iheyensis (strain DSM 14371 / CIP 107618 / JCM 11309 / KCTC 3954 / HTE831) TaxID=221109 RepID=Q8CUZ5_OCEIH|nr:metalloregulator ArsR/SmtB family transcription factor [Oceanobacillus iheyensis]BAC12918.1 transcriptional regulator (ArsR family) [Oceanobacillus iheyensis HTE831]
MSQQTMKLLRECTPVFNILRDENRQEILMLLFDEGQMSVNQIADRLTLSRPAISHHLKHLLDAKVVTVQKSATVRYYNLSLEHSIVMLKRLIQSLESDQHNIAKN